MKLAAGILVVMLAASVVVAQPGQGGPGQDGPGQGGPGGDGPRGDGPKGAGPGPQPGTHKASHRIDA